MFRTAGRIVTGTLAAIGLLFVTVTATPVVSWWAGKLAGPWTDPKGDTLIVLGGSMLDAGMIGRSSYWRGVYAARAFRGSPFRRVIVSGGPTRNSVAIAIRNFLVAEGVPAGVIETETESLSTHENAVNVARMLAGDNSRKVLLTSDYHMYRATRSFIKTGVQVIPRPFPDAIKESATWPGRWPVFLELSTETAKIGYYFVRGWI